jgi:hypothetical protein
MNQVVHKLSEPFPHLIVENMYNQEELDLIWEELNFLTKPHKFLQHDPGTGTVDTTGASKSESKSIYLDYIYKERSTSNILTVNRKLFFGGYLHIFSQISPLCSSAKIQSLDRTKIRYYENDSEYLPHIDYYNYTCITFFYKKPKLFEGGELYFPEYNYTLDCDNNHMIIFPSCILHAAKKVTMKGDHNCSGNGRYSMMQFLTWK